MAGVGEPAVARWLGGVGADAGSDRQAALERELAPGASRHDLWICSHDDADPIDVSMVTAMLDWGGAVLWEPVPALRPELFAWARPTLLTGSAEEIEVLLRGFVGLAPRWGRRRWIGRRLRRLRAALLTGGELGRVASALAPWTRQQGPRVLPFPGGRW